LTSNAALAGTVPSRQFDPSSDLRIPGRPEAYGIGTPANSTFTPAPTPRPTTYTPPYQPPPPPPANNTGVVLSGPIALQPPATPTSTRSQDPAPHSPVATHSDSRAAPSGGQPLSYEEAQRLLKQRGVVWQRLETWGDRGEWKFSCSVPNPQNAFISRNYEAKAANYLDAMRAALDQMSHDHR
jgi:hypothetical protein